jgi:hypothetical protein
MSIRLMRRSFRGVARASYGARGMTPAILPQLRRGSSPVATWKCAVTRYGGLSPCDISQSFGAREASRATGVRGAAVMDGSQGAALAF